MDAGLAVKWLIKELNAALRPKGFKRKGQNFTRESAEVWQVINVQVSRFSSSGEKRLTINFGIQPKGLMRLRQQDVSRAPLEYRCATRMRIGEFTETRKDRWWDVSDDRSAELALGLILGLLESEGIPLLDRLFTREGLIGFFESGKVCGFEIERDEAWMVLLAESGNHSELEHRLNDYVKRWPPSPADDRALIFLRQLQNCYGISVPVRH